MSWSKEQQIAISLSKKNILVAAAAGSGKTSVLVERVIQKIINKECNINEILLVTFTNAAASEMRERISLALEKQLPADQLEYQLALFTGSSISTLHSFCQSILRQYFHLIDLDPQFRLATEQEIDILRHECFENTLEEYYQQGDEAFLHLVDCYGSERGDNNLFDYINSLHKFALAQAFPQKWIKNLSKIYDDEIILSKENWFNNLIHLTTQRLEIAKDNAITMQKEAMDLGVDYAINIANDDIAIIDDWIILCKNNWDDFCISINKFKFSRFTFPKQFGEFKDKFKNFRDTTKSLINSICDDFTFQTLEELKSQLPILKKQVDAIIDFTLSFDRDFTNVKSRRNIVDFNDLEHLTLQILYDFEEDGNTIKPSEIAIKLQKKYKEIMVDEYQDTNAVQEAILNALINSKDNHLFAVGDIKQSIYRFRLADPGIFLDKYKNYPIQNNSSRIDLSTNYRSRGEILDSTNFIFSQLMTSSATELDYGEAEELKTGLEYPLPEQNKPILNIPVDLYLVNSKDKAIEAEADFIAKRIKELLKKQTYVFDKKLNTYRPIRYRDIAILMRTTSSKGQIVSQILQNADIPVYSSIDKGYFQELEIRIMLSLLKIIDNPLQDIPLIAILYSPIIGLTDNDLAKLRINNPNENIFDALVNYANNNSDALANICQSFLNKLENWRYFSRRHSVTELIWYLLQETDFYNYVGTLKDGNIRQANLRALHDRAAAYEKTSYRGLFRFLQFIKRMQSRGNDLSIARTLGEAEDVVRIMTIHKSKGLEFPIVFVPDIAKQFNLQDTNREMLFHKDFGIGLCAYDYNGQIRYDNVIKQAISQQLIKETKSEELRILYVAMTRAREHLILTGDLKKLDSSLKLAITGFKENKIVIQDYTILQAKSYLDWLIMALLRHPNAHKLQESLDFVPPILNTNSKWNIHLIDEDILENILPEKLQDDYKKLMLEKKYLPKMNSENQINAILDWKYIPTKSGSIPVKMSVTEIKNIYNNELEKLDNTHNLILDNTFKRPQFIKKERAITASERGLIMHCVMQHLDLRGDLSVTGIKEQIKNLIKEKLLTSKDSSVINYRQIASFFETEIGKSLILSKQVEREMKFGTMLDVNAELSLNNSLKDILPDGHRIFVQGIVDLLFKNQNNKWIILDYKTDRISEVEAFEKYKIQLQIYATVMGKILKEKISYAYIYLFNNASLIEIPL